MTQGPDVNELSSILAPLFSTFSFPQLETVLYAYLPTRLESYIHKTGIYAVDHFIVTATVTIVLVITKLIVKAVQPFLQPNTRKKHVKKQDISVLIEPVHQDDYHSIPNVYHQALLHAISEQSQHKLAGHYKLKQNTETETEPFQPPAFDMMPQPDQAHTIKYKGNQFQVLFQSKEESQRQQQGDVLPGSEFSKPGIRSTASSEPSISVSVLRGAKPPYPTVATISDFLKETTQDYLVYAESVKKKKSRSRYDYAVSGKWVRVCSLYEVQGLDTVALCPTQESQVKNDLVAFRNNKGFYKRIGFPYRRGYLIYGPPGTGKTSLIFAIASELERDLYFINLSYIDSDSELFQAFANVPSNSIVVFEDVDTMSTSLHARHTPSSHIQIQNSSDQQQKDERKFNLGSFLSILDGHTLEDGIVFLMTTNHKDRLDSAIIRPGRMDVHLELGYSTHYQMRRIYEMVMDDSSKLDDVYPSFENEIPEFVVPPSEIMQIMVLYRQDTALIPSNLKQIAGKYSKNTNEIMPLE